MDISSKSFGILIGLIIGPIIAIMLYRRYFRRLDKIQPSEHLLEFWNNTISVWRSGIPLPSVEAAGLATASNLRWFEDFFTVNPPQSQEILITFLLPGKKAHMVLTNQRLWMLDKKTHEYICLELADITQLQSQSGWSSFTVNVQFKDNTERIYQNVVAVPNDQMIEMAIKLGNVLNNIKLV
jgi:hypothetical protein